MATVTAPASMTGKGGGDASEESVQDLVFPAIGDTASIDWSYDDTANSASASVIPAGVNHNSLANVATGDVHTQYALLAGRATGQSIIGSSNATPSHTLRLAGGNATDTGGVLILHGASSTRPGYVELFPSGQNTATGGWVWDNLGRVNVGVSLANIALNFHQWTPSLTGASQYALNVHPVFGGAASGTPTQEVFVLSGRFQTADGANTTTRGATFNAATPSMGANYSLTRWAQYYAEPLAGPTHKALFTDDYVNLSSSCGLFFSSPNHQHYLGNKLGVGRFPYTNTVLSIEGGARIGGSANGYGCYMETTFTTGFSGTQHGFATALANSAAMTISSVMNYKVNNYTKNGGATLTRQLGYFCDTTFTAGANNAYFSDNETFTSGAGVGATGNFGIHLTATTQNYLKGALWTNNATLSTDASRSFLYIPIIDGTPTGAPFSYTGCAAIAFNATASKLFVFANGAWKEAALA